MVGSTQLCVPKHRGCGCNQRPINQNEEMAASEEQRQIILSLFTWTNMRYCYMLFILHGAFEVIPRLGSERLFVMRA